MKLAEATVAKLTRSLGGAAHLLAEADFNRSWIDGRIQSRFSCPEYDKCRRDHAEKCERWAGAIEALVRLFEGKVP